MKPLGDKKIPLAGGKPTPAAAKAELAKYIGAGVKAAVTKVPAAGNHHNLTIAL